MGQTGLGGAGRRHVAASVRLVVRRKAAVPVTPSGEHPSLADAKVILAHGGRTQVCIRLADSLMIHIFTRSIQPRASSRTRNSVVRTRRVRHTV
jgi:hypothetical protein